MTSLFVLSIIPLAFLVGSYVGWSFSKTGHREAAKKAATDIIKDAEERINQTIDQYKSSSYESGVKDTVEYFNEYLGRFNAKLQEKGVDLYIVDGLTEDSLRKWIETRSKPKSIMVESKLGEA